MKGWRRSAQFWKSIPAFSASVFFLAVFCLFAGMGFIDQAVTLGQRSLLQVLIWVMLAGLVGVIYAFTGTRRMFKSIIVFTLIQIPIWRLFDRYELENVSFPLRSFPQFEGLVRQVSRDGVGAVILISLGFGLFIVFFAREGSRFFKAHAEIRLASEIHKSLLPEVQRRLGRFECYGASYPSG